MDNWHILPWVDTHHLKVLGTQYENRYKRKYTVFACIRVCSKKTQAALWITYMKYHLHLREPVQVVAQNHSFFLVEIFSVFQRVELFHVPSKWRCKPPKRRRGWCGSTLSVSVAGADGCGIQGCPKVSKYFVEKSAASWNMSKNKHIQICLLLCQCFFVACKQDVCFFLDFKQFSLAFPL